MRILIIEDEKKTAAYLRKGLTENGPKSAIVFFISRDTIAPEAFDLRKDGH